MWLPMSYSTCQCINIYNIYIIYIIYIYIYISLHSHLETDSTVTAIQQWDKIRSYLPADVCTRWKHHVQSWIQGGTHHKDKDSNSCFSTAPEPKQWRLEVVQCCQLAHWRSFCLLLFLLSWQNRICILSQHHTSHMKMVQCVRHDIMNAQKNNKKTMYRLSIDIMLSHIGLSSSILLRRSQPDKWFLVFGLLHSIGQQLIQDFVRSHLEAK